MTKYYLAVDIGASSGKTDPGTFGKWKDGAGRSAPF